jgi:hypothetical protein
MVQGHPLEEITKNMEGSPLTDKQGNPRIQFFCAIAIPKNDPGYPALLAQIQQVAQNGFPGGQFNQPSFAWKILDGDSPEHKDKTGFPGHHVLKLSNGFSPELYTRNGESRITDPKQLKRGDYIRAYITIKANGSDTRPGIYLNMSMIELVGHGEEIISGPPASEVFGGSPAPLPSEASATPVAGPPVATPPTAPPVAPAHDFLNPKVMTQKANGVPYEAFIAQGWTEEQLKTEGYLA